MTFLQNKQNFTVVGWKVQTWGQLPTIQVREVSETHWEGVRCWLTIFSFDQCASKTKKKDKLPVSCKDKVRAESEWESLRNEESGYERGFLSKDPNHRHNYGILTISPQRKAEEAERIAV